MITRLEIDGFKSLCDFAVDLDPFTVFIGPNSAGKSNILDALALLSRLATQSIAEAFKHGRGRSGDQFTRRGAKVADRIRFAAEFLDYGDYPRQEKFQSRFRYELSIVRRTLRSGVERLVTQDESFRAMRREDDTWMHSHPELAEFAGYSKGGEVLFTRVKNAGPEKPLIVGLPSLWPEELNIPASHTALSHVRYIGVAEIRQNLEGYRSLHLDPRRLGESSDRIDSGELAPDASNLPAVLAELPAPLLGEIRADLATLVPGIASFEVIVDGDEVRIDFEISGGERVPARLISDGTLRVLALLTALRLEPRPRLMCIEEPENGIYPGRLRALVGLLRDETARKHDDPAVLEAQMLPGALGMTTNQLPTQILLTTHSPVILATLRSHLQHLRFVDTIRRDGQRFTRVRSVGPPDASERGRAVLSPREIDLILDAAQEEEL